jgi:hypothetical protein
VNNEVNVAVTNLWVLVKVTTNKEVPPALIALGVKDFATSGKLPATVSRSATVQIPAKQPVAVLVLVTVGGVEIDAVLVICVCANAVGEAKSTNIPTSTNATALVLRIIAHFTKAIRLNTFKFAKVYSQTLHCIVASYIVLLTYCIDIASFDTSNNPHVQLKAASCETFHKHYLCKL